MLRLSARLLSAALLLTAPFLTACGQKGPLYLPQDDPATSDAPFAGKQDKPASSTADR